MKFSELIETLHLPDSTLESVRCNLDGGLEIRIEIDDVWNKGIDSAINGLRFPSVFEIVNWKIDRMNIIGAVECTSLTDYDFSFVVNGDITPKNIVVVDFECVAGGQLTIVCEDCVEYLKTTTPTGRTR